MRGGHSKSAAVNFDEEATNAPGRVAEIHPTCKPEHRLAADHSGKASDGLNLAGWAMAEEDRLSLSRGAQAPTGRFRQSGR